MRPKINWRDELDEDELDVDQSESDVLIADTEPPDHGALSARYARSAISDDEPDAFDEFDAELEPEEIPDEGGFDVAVQYFQESARHQLLSIAQERALTQAVARGRSAAKRLARTRGSLNDATRRRLRRDIAQALTARDELVRSNARLIISVAKRYQDLGLPLMDLIQEGNIGFLRALERFEPARGLRLSTYATWWVRQGISRAVANHGRTIRLPAYLQDRLHQLNQVSQTLEQSLGRAPNDAELAQHLAISPADLRSLWAAAAPIVSLDDPVSDDDDESVLEQLEDAEVMPVDELVARRLLRTSLERALAELPARHAQIVRMRYGLDSDRPHSFEMIAQKLSLSRERVQQIQRDAFERLRLSTEVRDHQVLLAA